VLSYSWTTPFHVKIVEHATRYALSISISPPAHQSIVFLGHGSAPFTQAGLCAIIEGVHLVIDVKPSDMLLFLYLESVLFSLSPSSPMIRGEGYKNR
jgi:hypothetical protein